MKPAIDAVTSQAVERRVGRTGPYLGGSVQHIDRRQALKLLGALGAAGLASACALSDDDDSRGGSATPVRIGLLTPQSGANKPVGEDMRNGFQLYLGLNGQRLGGHPVELVTADEGDSAKTGQAALKQLLDRNVLALVGVASSTVMTAIRPAIEAAKVPLIGSNASPAALTGSVFIWRTSYVDDEPGRALGPYVSEQVRGKVALITADSAGDPSGRDAIEGFRFSFGSTDERIVDSLVSVPYSARPGAGYYAGTLNELEEMDPDAVYCTLSGNAAVEFIKQYRAAGLRKPLYAPGFATEGASLTALGESGRDVFTALNYSSDLDNPANRRFATAYRQEHSTSPTTYAMAAYDAAAVLDKAISLAGSELTPLAVNLSLSKIGQVDSPRGTWQFNQSRTPQQVWYLRQVREDGRVLANVVLGQLATLG